MHERSAEAAGTGAGRRSLPVSARLLLAAVLSFTAVFLFAAVPALAADAAGPPTPGAPPACARRAAAGDALARLRDSLARHRYVAYSPTSLQVHDGRVTPANDDSVRADLRVLRERFDGLVTYSAADGAERIPAIAAQLGFAAVIVGVWDPGSASEIDAALAAYRSNPKLVVGLSVGNELLLSKRGSAAMLRSAIARVRARAPALPVATSEPFHLHYDGDGRTLLGDLDFLLPNVHPVFQAWWREAPDANGAAFVVGVLHELQARFCGPILVKETGVPTAPADRGFTPGRQASFYRALRASLPPTRDAAFAYFSAFDAPWRVADEQAVAGHHPEEAHWGLYDAERRPKPAALDVPTLGR